MKTLVKCKLYVITLLTAVLSTVGTALSDNHTDVSIQESQQTTQKPTIMILGSAHLANKTLDPFNVKMDDVLAPKRQREMEQLVTQLKAYQPTKIALEVDDTFDAEVERKYQEYLKRGRIT